MTELRSIPHERVDVEHGTFADENVPPERDRPELEPPSLRPVALQHRFLADHRPCADGQQIGAHRHAPGEDHDAGPDSRAQRPQVKEVHGRADEHAGGRARSDERLDDPEPEVSEAPQADVLALPTADEHPLRRDRNAAGKEESRATGQYQAPASLDGTRAARNPPAAPGHVDYA